MNKHVLTILIICLALFVRLYGLKWDQGHHLHPDERFLTMVTSDSRIPESLEDYLDPTVSTLNPYNIKYPFYVYGTFPIATNKLVAHAVDMDSYDGTLVTGRVLSALLDVVTLLFVIAIAGSLRKKYDWHEYFPQLSGFLYAIAVLPIQNGHFFTVDSFAVVFATGALYWILRFVDKRSLVYALLGGVFFGLSLASKISSIYISPLLGLLLGYGLVKEMGWSDGVRVTSKNLKSLFTSRIVLGTILFVSISYAALRLGSPHYFASASWHDLKIHKTFMTNIEELGRFTSPDAGFYPPSIQWIAKEPVIFAGLNIILFGLGLPYALFAIYGLLTFLLEKKPLWMMIAGWAIIYFIYQSSRFTSTMRYFYILYPVFAIAASIGMMRCIQMLAKAVPTYSKLLTALIFLAILIWPISFMMIYTRPHSRVSASEWIYENIPAGSFIATEHWDDALPLILEPESFSYSYQGEQLPIFGEDTQEKWQEMKQIYSKSNYYILSSNRGYGSISTVPEKYPLMSRFYKDLFAGRTHFELVAEFTSFPTIPLLNIELNDQWSEEAFTVYDHPRVLIFKKKVQ